MAVLNASTDMAISPFATRMVLHLFIVTLSQALKLDSLLRPAHRLPALVRRPLDQVALTCTLNGATQPVVPTTLCQKFWRRSGTEAGRATRQSGGDRRQRRLAVCQSLYAWQRKYSAFRQPEGQERRRTRRACSRPCKSDEAVQQGHRRTGRILATHSILKTSLVQIPRRT